MYNLLCNFVCRRENYASIINNDHVSVSDKTLAILNIISIAICELHVCCHEMQFSCLTTPASHKFHQIPLIGLFTMYVRPCASIEVEGGACDCQRHWMLPVTARRDVFSFCLKVLLHVADYSRHLHEDSLLLPLFISNTLSGHVLDSLISVDLSTSLHLCSSFRILLFLVCFTVFWFMYFWVCISYVFFSSISRQWQVYCGWLTLMSLWLSW